MSVGKKKQLLIGVLVPVTSRGRDLRDPQASDFLRRLLPSFIKTASWDGCRHYRIYVGFDAGDPFYDHETLKFSLERATARALGSRPAALVLVRLEDTQHAPCWAWNQLARRALADGCEYFYQVGDDVELETTGWAIDFPAALESNPICEGLGVTGPVDGNNSRILTQSFVSRLHLELFGAYFPSSFKNWWSDDWLTAIYTPDYRREPSTRHTVNNCGGPHRYRVEDVGRMVLNNEIERGRRRIQSWLAARALISRAQDSESSSSKFVIAFSLWGDKAKYTRGALVNAQLTAEIYPGWICRIYVAASVPADLVEELQTVPWVEVVRVNSPGDWGAMLWRFRPAMEPDTSVLLSRDADSRLSWRERAAVDEWLGSDREFHIMRDHPRHLSAPILGGMWGARGKALRIVECALQGYEPGNYWQTDQDFLRNRVYPHVANSALRHDEFAGGRPFPISRYGNEYVGEPLDEDGRPDDHVLRVELAAALDNQPRVEGLFVQFHQSLGDHLIGNGLMRELARRHGRVVLPCKRPNCAAVTHMYRDAPIDVMEVENDEQASDLARAYEEAGGAVLRLGIFGDDFLNGSSHFDESFYQQAGIPFALRWDAFSAPRDETEEQVFANTVNIEPYAFLYEDLHEGPLVTPPPALPVVRACPCVVAHLFAWRKVIERAEEVHCVESHFSCWIDALPDNGQRLVLHRYVNRGKDPRLYSNLRRPWQILA